MWNVSGKLLFEGFDSHHMSRDRRLLTIVLRVRRFQIIIRLVKMLRLQYKRCWKCQKQQRYTEKMSRHLSFVQWLKKLAVIAYGATYLS
jgi:hypothetical protein